METMATARLKVRAYNLTVLFLTCSFTHVMFLFVGVSSQKLPSYHSPSPPTNGARSHNLHEHSPYIGSDQPKLRGDSRGTTPLRSDHSFGEEEGYASSSHQYRPMAAPSNRYRDVVGQSIPESTHLPQGHEELLPRIQRRKLVPMYFRRCGLLRGV